MVGAQNSFTNDPVYMRYTFEASEDSKDLLICRMDTVNLDRFEIVVTRKNTIWNLNFNSIQQYLAQLPSPV